MHSVPENGEPASTRASMHTGVLSGPRVVEGGPGATGGAKGTTGAHAGQRDCAISILFPKGRRIQCWPEAGLVFEGLQC
jgi:hypothetical protein